MQWWCAAQGEVWEWTWQPYPGVWLFILLLSALYFRIWSRTVEGVDRVTRRGHLLAGLAGIVALWLALDWPIGALGAGYLASVHMIQYLLIVLVSPPLLLFGIPLESYPTGDGTRGSSRILRLITRPAFTLPLFVGVTLVTHIPVVVDALMASQIGNFVVDAIWFLSGILFWWPIVTQKAAGKTFPFPLQALYLFPAMLIHTAIAVYLVFGRFPRYATYELAPPTGWISAVGDQQIAGGLMWVAGTPIMWSVMGFVFRRWVKANEGEAEEAGAATHG